MQQAYDWPGGPTGATGALWTEVLGRAVSEAARWGEPVVQYGPAGVLCWAAPLMHNAQLRGAIVAGIAESVLFPTGINEPIFDTRRACVDLLDRVEAANLTNAALLQHQRDEAQREQHRAYALHAFKREASTDLRRVYLRQEPELLAAIRRGDRGAARIVLNHILVIVFSAAGERFDLLKSFSMELVATVCRTAVEAGARPEQVLGENYTALQQLAEIEDIEALSPWLCDLLERVMDTIAHHPDSAATMLVNRALQHMREQMSGPLGRDDVAAAVHVSPAHFSRLFRRVTGQSFSQTLRSMRLDEAARLLVQTDRPVGRIAAETGFVDAAHFTKSFQRHTGQSPTAYRQARQKAPAEHE